MAWDKIHAGFDVREGHGHVKPNFSVKDRPPDMLINVVIDTPDHMPVIGEIQIHYRPVLELKVCQLTKYVVCFLNDDHVRRRAIITFFMKSSARTRSESSSPRA